MGKKAALYLVVCMFEIQLNNKIMEIGATCTVYNFLHGWSREQNNRTMPPTLKNNAATGYQVV